MSAALPDLQRLVDQLRGDVFIRFMTRAQKAALLAWRDRKQAPGLAARFERQGRDFYGFARRKKADSDRQRKGHPYYVKSGALRAMMARKGVKADRGNRYEVVTRMSLSGGALNLLKSMRGIASSERVSVTGTSRIAAYSYGRKIKRTGTTIRVQVPGSTRTYRGKMTYYTKVAASYAAQFADLTKDRRWIAERVGLEFSAIFRQCGLDRRGNLRSAYREHLDREAA